MSLSSHVTTNLDEWVENGFIHVQQREAFAQLLESACEDAEQAGYDKGYDDGYDVGYTDGSD